MPQTQTSCSDRLPTLLDDPVTFGRPLGTLSVSLDHCLDILTRVLYFPENRHQCAKVMRNGIPGPALHTRLAQMRVMGPDPGTPESLEVCGAKGMLGKVGKAELYKSTPDAKQPHI